MTLLEDLWDYAHRVPLNWGERRPAHWEEVCEIVSWLEHYGLDMQWVKANKRYRAAGLCQADARHLLYLLRR
jgi:hypothetical protein